MLDYVLQDGALDPDEVLFYTSEIVSLRTLLRGVFLHFVCVVLVYVILITL